MVCKWGKKWICFRNYLTQLRYLCGKQNCSSSRRKSSKRKKLRTTANHADFLPRHHWTYFGLHLPLAVRKIRLLRRKFENCFGLEMVSRSDWFAQCRRLLHALVCVSCSDTGGISSVNKTLDKAERRKVLETLLPARILADYDLYGFDIDQMERLKKYPFLYRCIWFVERVLFKLEKWKIKYCSWEKVKKK